MGTRLNHFIGQASGLAFICGNQARNTKNAQPKKENQQGE
jgi:hypothetical protein